MIRRFRIRFDPVWRWVFGLLFLSPSQCYLELTDDEVEVRFSWAFRARFPRRAVASAEACRKRVLSLGVHGLFGRWLVNGSSQGLVTLRLEPTQRARMMGLPISLRELMVSVEEPDALLGVLSASRR